MAGVMRAQVRQHATILVMYMQRRDLSDCIATSQVEVVQGPLLQVSKLSMMFSFRGLRCNFTPGANCCTGRAVKASWLPAGHSR